MPESDRVKATWVYGTNCHHHLGNTWFDGGAKAEGKLLGALLADDLADAEPQACEAAAAVG